MLISVGRMSDQVLTFHCVRPNSARGQEPGHYIGKQNVSMAGRGSFCRGKTQKHLLTRHPASCPMGRGSKGDPERRSSEKKDREGFTGPDRGLSRTRSRGTACSNEPEHTIDLGSRREATHLMPTKGLFPAVLAKGRKKLHPPEFVPVPCRPIKNLKSNP